MMCAKGREKLEISLTMESFFGLLGVGGRNFSEIFEFFSDLAGEIPREYQFCCNIVVFSEISMYIAPLKSRIFRRNICHHKINVK